LWENKPHNTFLLRGERTKKTPASFSQKKKNGGGIPFAIRKGGEGSRVNLHMKTGEDRRWIRLFGGGKGGMP